MTAFFTNCRQYYPINRTLRGFNYVPHTPEMFRKYRKRFLRVRYPETGIILIQCMGIIPEVFTLIIIHVIL